MPFWAEGDPSRENPPSALTLTDSSDRFGDLSSWADSLHWLPEAFSFCLPGRELPTGLVAKILQLGILYPHGLRR